LLEEQVERRGIRRQVFVTGEAAEGEASIELVCAGDELADVLDPLRPFGALRLERGDEPDLLDQQLDQLTDGRTCGKIPEPGDQAGERDERGGPGAAQQLAFLRA